MGISCSSKLRQTLVCVMIKLSPVIFGHKVFAIHFHCWVLHWFDLTEASGCFYGFLGGFFGVLFSGFFSIIRDWFLVFMQSVCKGSAVVSVEQWHCGFPWHLSWAGSCRLWHPGGSLWVLAPGGMWLWELTFLPSQNTHPPCACRSPGWGQWAGRQDVGRVPERKAARKPQPKRICWINFLPWRQRNKLVRFCVEGSFGFKDSQVFCYWVLQRRSTSP